MRIMNLNVNGIRAAARKGLFEWLPSADADVVCLQEVRAQPAQLVDACFRPRGYHCYYHLGKRPGYGGVALYARREPDRVVEGLGWPDVDAEGRYLEARFGRLSVVSLYVPSGSSGEVRQAVKFAFLERFLERLHALRGTRRSYVVCADWNIAHRPIDLKNWRSNQKNSGFLPEERAWLDRVFGEAGYVDAFRVVNEQAEQYTWWSNRGQAWSKNVGWRLDYQVVSPGMRRRVLGAEIYKDRRFSDHAPLIIEYDYPF